VRSESNLTSRSTVLLLLDGVDRLSLRHLFGSRHRAAGRAARGVGGPPRWPTCWSGRGRRRASSSGTSSSSGSVCSTKVISTGLALGQNWSIEVIKLAHSEL
jgi:hypothetical protein